MPDYLFNSEPTLTPSKLADATGLSVDMQRDWRRRGYLKLGTAKDSGHWLYDWYDAFSIYLMRQLYQGGLELTRAQMFAATIGQDVLTSAINARYPNLVIPRTRFFRFQKDERGKAEHGHWVAVRFNKLEVTEARSVGFLVDCAALAAELPAVFDEPISNSNVVANRKSDGGGDG